MLKKIWFLVFGFWFLVSFAYAQEQITITTYYPSPFGSYNELTVAGRQAIGDVNGDGNVDANDLAVDGAGNPIDDSLTVAGRVGIGTRNPDHKLTIQNTFPQSLISLDARNLINSYARISYRTDGFDWVAGAKNDGVTDGFDFESNVGGWHTVMVLKNNGKVGIGTTNPDAHLTVGSNLIGTTLLDSEIRVGVAGADNKYAVVRVGQGSTNHGYLAWYAKTTAANAFLAVGTLTGNNPLVLQDAGGNVGIGTTNPQAKLDVAGDVIANNLWIKIGEVDLNNSAGYTFLGLDGNAQKMYKVLFQGSIAAGGANRYIYIRPNGSFMGSRSVVEATGESVFSEIQGTGFVIGRNDHNVNAIFSFEYTISAITGRKRTGHGQSVFCEVIPPGNNHVHICNSGGFWWDTVTNITSLVVAPDGGCTITGKLILFALR